MNKKIQKKTCEFVEFGSLIPKNWSPARREQFFCDISDNAPFSWGDNNRTLVTASAFANHCQLHLDDSRRTQAFLRKLWTLGETYVDLEN